MKRKRFTEEQIIKVLKEFETGIPAKEVCRKNGMCEQTLYKWKRKYHGMEVADAKKLKAMEDENRRLKRLVADLSLDNQMLKEVAKGNF
ncbi:MAG: transposase [Halobacteriovoraceae bacterium]|jgi:putative transposase|nr:transposase [Halobacteriovoraceae bacterium]